MRQYLLLGVLLIAAVVAFANDGYVVTSPVTGSLVGADTDAVKLESERVTYDGRTGEFEAIFRLKNISSKPVSIDVGFPLSSAEVEDLHGTHEFDPDSFEFTTTVNGASVLSSFESVEFPNTDLSGALPSFVTRDISIAAGATVVVAHRYIAPPASILRSNTGQDRYHVEYIASTGASWAGTVDVAEFVFRVPVRGVGATGDRMPYTVLTAENGLASIDHHASPAGYEQRFVEDYVEFSWRFEDIDPDFSLTVTTDVLGTPWQYSDPLRLWRYGVSRDDASGSALTIEDDLERYGISARDYYKLLVAWLERLRPEPESSEDREELYNTARMIVNYGYALAGHEFRGERWRSFFSGFSWYSPASEQPVVLPADLRALIDRAVAVREAIAP